MNGKRRESPTLDTEREREAPAHIFEDPKVKARIAESLTRSRRGSEKSGKTADELLDLAREQSRVDPEH